MITIQLPPDLEQVVRTQAAQSGVAVETLVLEALRKDFSKPDAGSFSEREARVNSTMVETSEAFIPDADRPNTPQEMAQAWQQIASPITQDDVGLSVDPDDYPLF